MKPRFVSRLTSTLALISFTLVAGNAQAQTWANSNITATPTAIYDWFSGGPNTQATWSGGDPASANTTTVTFFQDTSTALTNSVQAGSTQTANLNNGGSAFELGTLTLNGKGSATAGVPVSTYPHHFESISGSALNFSGATGTINLSANNGATQGTAITVLTYQVANNIQLGTASSASALTLTGGGTSPFFISGNISELQTGGGSLTKSGGSLAILSGNNTYTGATSVTGGTLRLGSVNALPGGIGATGGTSALTLNGGTVELGANDFLRNLGSGVSEFQITGGTSGFSTKMGVRSVIVSNDAAQEIQWGSTSFSPTTLVLNGSGADAQLTLQNKIDLNGSTTRTVSSAGFGEQGSAVISGIIRNSTGTAGLTKTGAGILKLHGANTFDGVVTVSAGTLSINTIANGGATNSSSLGESSNAASSLILNGGTLRYTGVAASSDRLFSLQISGGLDASGTGALNLNNTAAMGFNGGTAAKTLTLTGSNPGNNTLAALIGNNTGATSITKTGLGNWVLSNTNTFTGVVTVSAGTLSINSIDVAANANPLGQSGTAAANLVLGGGTLKYTGSGGSSDRAFTLSGNSTIDSSGSGPLDLNNSAIALAYGTVNTARTLTLSGTNTGDNKLTAVIANNGTGLNILAKAGKGTWVLNGSAVNTYTGATQVNTGTLKLDFANLPTPTDLINSGSALTLGGGTLALQGKDSTASSQSFVGNPTFGSQAGSGISITGGSGSTMDLVLSNTWTRNSGSTVNITLGTGGSVTSAPTTADGIVVGSGNIAFATVNGTDWATVSTGKIAAYSAYDTSFPASGSTNTVNYSLTGSGSVSASQTANTLKINTSGTGQSLDIASGQTQILRAGGLLFIGANDYSITGGTLMGSGQSQKNLVVHQYGVGKLTIDSVIANNTDVSGLVTTGTGTVILSQANTHTGTTFAGGGGTLILKHQDALKTSALSVNNSSIVFDSSVTGNAFTLGGLSSPYAGPGYDIALQNNAGSPAAIALTVTGAGTYAGVLSGTGSLIKTGSGTLTLSGLNTYTGGTTISGGTLALASNNNWTLGGGGTFGNVQVTVNSPGTLQFNGATMTGAMTLNGGTLTSNTGALTTWFGTINLQATSTITGSNNGHFLIPAVISGTGGLTKNGATYLSLSNANTFSGDTKVIGGMLLVSHPLALQNSTLDTNGTATGTQDLGFRATVDTLTLGGLGGNKNLSAVFTTGFGGSYSYNLNNPTVQTFSTPLGGYRGLTSLTLNPGTGKTPSYSGVIADGAPGMSVIKTGLGTQTLTGTHTYTGATIVNAGILALGASNVLPDVSAVSIGAATLDLAGFTDSTGTLDVTGAATLNLGTGTLAFANSNAVDWTGGTLNVTGTLGATSLRFGTTSSGLTVGQLALISVNGSGAGTYTLNASGYLVAGGGGSAYDTWAAVNAPTGDPDDDYDGDGVSNAVEFVLGGLATTNDLNKLPVPDASGSNLTFTFKRDVDSIDPKTALFIETSTDLATWNNAPSPYTVGANTAGSTSGVTVLEDTPAGFDTIILTVPKGLDAKKFARIKVVITP